MKKTVIFAFTLLTSFGSIANVTEVTNKLQDLPSFSGAARCERLAMFLGKDYTKYQEDANTVGELYIINSGIKDARDAKCIMSASKRVNRSYITGVIHGVVGATGMHDSQVAQMLYEQSCANNYTGGI
ncbi:hypothetical protein [Vibrio brasiliensis]|uniref:hypothetical protein n=1 Tax=Vibrio brasiliensis TaxID=170652 RepID=UPI001EFDCCB2|nr:hypothetical protein [Vibrio brasiliensis]MCG9727499.1 hypothetical protein [Vibrio brasiliensis]